MMWLHCVIGADELEVWRLRARASVLDLNDGIVSAAGIAEGFASVGASASVLLVAAVATILAGGLAAAGARYTEVRTEWEMNRALVEAERASIEADPDGEFEELVGIYQAKGLGSELAQQVAAALTERDPVAAHADAELRLDDLDTTSRAVPAGVGAGISYGIGAALPLTGMLWLPSNEREILTFVVVLIALGLTGWLASWLTGLPTLRLVRRNVALGGATMAASLLIGLVIEL
jgi:VIT1/CCC1 family predicted Fe2+/Mn2+ transporter